MTTSLNTKRDSVATYLDVDGRSYWRNPPEIESIDDFDRIDLDQLRVEFMRISPSYALRCQLASARLNEENKRKKIFSLYQNAFATAKFRGLESFYSADRTRVHFEKFQKTYEHLDQTYQEYGNILVPYSDWYLRTGKNVFDNWTNRRDVKFIGVMNLSGPTHPTNSQIKTRLQNYVAEISSKKEWPPTMFLGIPFDLPKQTAMKHIRTLLDSYYDFMSPIKDQKYRTKKFIEGERERPDALSRRLKMLVCKAFYPDAQLWKLGLVAGVSKAHMLRFYDATTSADEFRTLRPQLAALANRAIRNGQYIAEHASFDSFPVQTKVVTPFYDWDAIRERIKQAHPHLKIKLPRLLT